MSVSSSINFSPAAVTPEDTVTVTVPPEANVALPVCVTVEATDTVALRSPTT